MAACHTHSVQRCDVYVVFTAVLCCAVVQVWPELKWFGHKKG